MKNEDIMVTGGAGFLGSHVVRLLLEQENRVTVFDNFSTGKMLHLNAFAHHPLLRIVRGDVLNVREVQSAFQGCGILIHLAVQDLRLSIKDPGLVNETITAGTINCLDAARQNDAKLFLNCSSAEVYGSARYTPIDEMHPMWPETPYAAAKVAQDMYVYSYGRSFGLPWSTIRLFNMYGPNSHWQGRRGELIPKMIVRAMSGKPLVIFGDGGQTRDFVYVEDAARALILGGENPECLRKTIQFCTGVETSILTIARLICEAFGIDPDEGIKFQQSRPGDVIRQVGDNTLFKRVVGFGPTVDIREGIRRTVSWYRSLSSSPMELFSQEVLRNWE